MVGPQGKLPPLAVTWVLIGGRCVCVGGGAVLLSYLLGHREGRRRERERDAVDAHGWFLLGWWL